MMREMKEFLRRGMASLLIATMLMPGMSFAEEQPEETGQEDAPAVTETAGEDTEPVVGATPSETGENETASADAATLPDGVAETAADVARQLREGIVDVTGNGTGDEADAMAQLMHMTGSLPDLAGLPEILSDSLLGEKYLDQFSYTGIQQGETYYKSEKISYHLTTVHEDKLVYYVADILLRDILCYRTQFSGDAYRSKSEKVTQIAARNNAIIAVNGDYFRAREDGMVIRNGVAYRTKAIRKRDLCALFYDGTMETYDYNEIGAESLLEQGCYQCWDFGPSLLNADGSVKTKSSEFSTNVFTKNPRTAIGYIEPGHYVFVVVDGRGMNKSYGLDLADLSSLMASLGCKVAYNLDGGGTSCMTSAVYGDINKTSDENRSCSDIVMIVEDYSAFEETENG